MSDPIDLNPDGPSSSETVTLEISARVAELLRVLVDPEQGYSSLQDVIDQLLDHAQQGVYRPGAWERDWLCQVFGEAWTERLETDPETPYFQRPIRPCPNDPPCEHPEAAHDPGAGAPGSRPWCLDCTCGDDEEEDDG